MKVYHVLTIAALFMAVLMAVMTGCKYDVAEPQWYSSVDAPPAPNITSITPANIAGAGVNTIVITGTNFAESPDSNLVYFTNAPATILSASSTSLTVLRPNLVTDSAYIKVVSPKALVVAKFPQPYKIERVHMKWGAFLVAAEALSGAAIDNNENLYITNQVSKKVFKVDATNNTTQVALAPAGVVTRNPSDAKIGPDGNLYIMSTNRAIEMMDVQTGVVSEWVRLASGKNVKFGDFDANGYFYTGGARSDLFVIAPDKSFIATNLYSKDEILSVRVYNGYLYLLIKLAGTGTVPIFVRHSIGAGGVLGAQQVMLDWNAATVGEFASRSIRGFTFAADGTMYLVTDSVDPVLMVDLTTKTVQILYKGILPGYCKYFCGSSRHYLYLITGDSTLGQEWAVYRVDIGVEGTPYF
jgi:hypothetical protein